MTEKEFEVLKTIACTKQNWTQRELVLQTGYSLGTINRILNRFVQEQWIDAEYNILANGFDQLESYKVKHAIILAAGMSSETNPISKHIPKGLYVAKGDVLIERLIEQLQAAGVEDIYVVVGFKMDQFFYLEEKYNVKIVVNNEYALRNNNGSIRCVMEHLSNSYIIPNDEYFTENVFSLYEYRSFYSTVYSTSKTKEAFVKLNDKDQIINVYKGGNQGWTMLGHCYMDADYAKCYQAWFEKVYDFYETKKLFWEEIFYPHLKEFPLFAKKYEPGIIFEFDELSELEGFDNQFLNNINPEIYKYICHVFQADRNEITDIQPVHDYSIDTIFRFKVRNDDFVFRFPSRTSLHLIDYSQEQMHNSYAKRLGLDESFFSGSKNGYRISMVSKTIQDLNLDACISLLDTMKSQNVLSTRLFDFKEEIEHVYEKMNDNQLVRAQKFNALKKEIFDLLTWIEKDDWNVIWSHNNISASKFRKLNESYILVDWHFSGMSDPGYDIAELAYCFDFDEKIVNKYSLRHLYACLAVSRFYRFILGIYYSDTRNEFSDALYENWNVSLTYANKAKTLYANQFSTYITQDQQTLVESAIQASIQSMRPLTGGVTNTTYQMVDDQHKAYALRIPGKGTNEYINRKDEMLNISTISCMDILPNVVLADPDSGILLLDYLEDCIPCSIDDVHDLARLKPICELLYRVHTSNQTFHNEFDLIAMQAMYRNHLHSLGGQSPESVRKEEKRMDYWMNYLFTHYPKELVTCHIDPKLNNFLKKDGKLYLIDWEYSGMADCYFELANFSLTNNLTQEEERDCVEMYFQVSHTPFIQEKFLLYKFATDYVWIYWHLIKCQQHVMIEYNEMSWKKRLRRILHILDQLEKE